MTSFTFTQSGYITFAYDFLVEYLIVGGGGGGGSGGGGGGGGGGYIEANTIFYKNTIYTITVGSGGNGANGGDSSLSSSILSQITSYGGGKGADRNGIASSGGSGGGGGHSCLVAISTSAGGSGVSGQGNSGGAGTGQGSCASSTSVGGGGGGAGGVGSAGLANSSGGLGGSGKTYWLTSLIYAAGGSGGAQSSSTNGVNGSTNTGSGGSGSNATPGSGGSGVVVISAYKTIPQIQECTIWLDATLSSNWTSGIWKNNGLSKSSNAILLKGTWSSSSWVSNGINGLPSIQFSGTNSLYTTDPTNTYSNGVTFFVVFQPSGNNTYRTLVSRTETTMPSPFDIYNNLRFIGNGTTSTYSYLYSPNNLSSLTLGSPYIFAYRISVSGTTATATEWLSGDIQYSNLQLSGYSDTGTSVQIGTRGDNATSFTGYMGEVVMYKTALTDTQVLGVNLYLSQKWGVNVLTSYTNTKEARYVRLLRLDSKSEYVHVAEIQVFDKTGNQITPAGGQMSDTLSGYSNSNVYDNNISTFAHTATASSSSFVQIDLGSDKTIGKIVVFSRVDSNLLYRMVGCGIRLYNNSTTIVYTSPTITTQEYTYTFTF